MEAPPQGAETGRGLRPARRGRTLAIAGLAVAAVALSGCNLPAFGFHRGATTQAQDTFKLWQGFFLAGLVVFALVFCLIVYAMLRYRRRSDEIPKQTQYHTVFEIFYTVVPVVIVLILFAFTFITENEVDALPPNPGVHVHVIAFQWGWDFEYTHGGNVTSPAYAFTRGEGNIIDGHVVESEVPTMLLPVGETVHFWLTSNDVIHGFYIPTFNFSRYAQPGVERQQFDFDVLHAGTYRGQCTQLCGLYHSVMLFNVRAVPPSTFNWCLQNNFRLNHNVHCAVIRNSQRLENEGAGRVPIT